MMSNPPRRNPWIIAVGAAMLVALAVGLLNGGANAASVRGASGYGQPSGPPVITCTMGSGYTQTACDPQVANLDVSPSKPVRGKGFVISFSTKSGGEYSVSVVKSGFKKALANGVAGVGKIKTKTIGKGVKAGTYKLRVSIKSNNKTASKQQKLVIRKRG